MVQYEYVQQQAQQAVPQGWQSLTPISAQQANQLKTQQMAAEPSGGYAVFSCFLIMIDSLVDGHFAKIFQSHFFAIQSDDKAILWFFFCAAAGWQHQFASACPCSAEESRGAERC